MPVWSEVKAWFLANLAMILGVALVLTGLYVSWLRFVEIPALKVAASVAIAQKATAEANTSACLAANQAFANTTATQSESIKQLASLGALTRADVAKVLKSLGPAFENVARELAAYKPDKAKTDCENAYVELAKFRGERGR